MKDSRRFYKELGNLFYAIAAADKQISAKEKEVVDREVQFAWKHFDNSFDRFGTDRAYLVEFEFETMEENDVSSADAFASFAAWFTENEQGIDRHTRDKIFQSARHIAEGTRRINRHELPLLVQLKALMNV